MRAPSPLDILARHPALQRREHAAVIGAGTIGASWTALFLAHGMAVCVNDPAPDAEERVRSMIDQARPVFSELGLATDDLTERLSFTADVARAVDSADVVQENGPESVQFKRALWADVENTVSPDALLLSSTSGIKATAMAKYMRDPTRVLVGHPFNPPHLVPLIEVVPGEQTSRAVVDEAVAFYTALGKRPLVLRKESPGFVANRLQSALFQECVHLVADGVVDIADLDAIVVNSIGLRWASGGPFLSFHLGGGTGGFPHFLEHLAPGMERMWEILGHPHFDEDTKDLLVHQVQQAYGDWSLAELEQRRDRLQIALLRVLHDER